MKKVLRAGVLALAGVAAVLLVGAATAASAPKATSSPAVASVKATFSGSYAGKAIVSATSDTAASINAKGAGKSNVLGASTLTGLGVGFQGTPCNSFSGKGTIKGKLGQLNFTVAPGAKACPSTSDSNQNAITATAKVTGGTLKFKKAKGLLKITGNYDRGKGTFTSTLKGALTY